jgi:hypothetical protein
MKKYYGLTGLKSLQKTVLLTLRHQIVFEGKGILALDLCFALRARFFTVSVNDAPVGEVQDVMFASGMGLAFKAVIPKNNRLPLNMQR